MTQKKKLNTKINKRKNIIEILFFFKKNIMNYGNNNIGFKNP